MNRACARPHGAYAELYMPSGWLRPGKLGGKAKAANAAAAKEAAAKEAAAKEAA